MASRYLEPYNPRAYVPGGSSAKKARAIQTQGKITPVVKKKNPYVRPLPGGGSGAVSPAFPNMDFHNSPNLAGVNAQTNKRFFTPPVSTTLQANYESDPVLARIRALGQQNVGNAKTEAAALRKQAILDTGLTDIGREAGVDENTLQAAQNNPLSLLAQLGREGTLRGQQLDEQLNQENLFWSGHRGTQLSQLAESQAAAQAALARDLRSALAGINSGVLAAEEAQAMREAEELERVAAEQQAAAMQKAYLDALALAANPGSTVEAGAGGVLPALGGAGSIEYAPGPTPAQVENMVTSGIDPNTAIFAPQPTMIHGPGNVPSLPTVAPIDPMAPANWTVDSLLPDPAPRGVTMGSGLGLPAPVLAQTDPADPYALDNLMMLLALQSGQNYF